MVQKTYLALVRGGDKSFAETRGKVRIPLRFVDGRVSIAKGDDKAAVTDWELLGSSVSDFPYSVRLDLNF